MSEDKKMLAKYIGQVLAYLIPEENDDRKIEEMVRYPKKYIKALADGSNDPELGKILSKIDEWPIKQDKKCVAISRMYYYSTDRELGIHRERMRIANLLDSLRIEEGLSIPNLATKSDLTQLVVNKALSGKYSTGIDELSRMAKALGRRIELVKSNETPGIEIFRKMAELASSYSCDPKMMRKGWDKI